MPSIAVAMYLAQVSSFPSPQTRPSFYVAKFACLFILKRGSVQSQEAFMRWCKVKAHTDGTKSDAKIYIAHSKIKCNDTVGLY